MFETEAGKYVLSMIGNERPQRMEWTFRQEPEGMIAVFHGQLGMMMYLNPTAAFIFSNCDGRHTIEDIAHLLHRKFPDISLTDLTIDVIKCVRDLQGRGLLHYARCEY